MDAMKALGRGALANRIRRNAERDQLIKPEHDMLSRGQAGDRSILRSLSTRPAIFSAFVDRLWHKPQG
jgi:hypothetical protein